MAEKIEIKPTSIETVALQLTETIAISEKLNENEHSQDFRKKYLDLYAECHEAASGLRKIQK